MKTPWEIFFREKVTKIFTEKKLIVDIGGGTTDIAVICDTIRTALPRSCPYGPHPATKVPSNWAIRCFQTYRIGKPVHFLHVTALASTSPRSSSLS